MFMHVVVAHRPGPPSVLKLESWSIPPVKPGWTRIRVRAFGVNRSELLTRQGLSPSVTFPRILGIECVGEVDDPSDSGFAIGQPVAAAMGGMGRSFDGSYAESVLVPNDLLVSVNTSLDWPTLAAIPETYQTAYGSLTSGLRACKGQTLLVRGGTSSVGLAAIDLGKMLGLRVIATTRPQSRAAKASLLRDAGADVIWTDDGSVATKDRGERPDLILELVGTTTLRDSLATVVPGGTVCVCGILGGSWTLDDFDPFLDLPDGVTLTSFSSGPLDTQELTRLIRWVEAGALRPRIDRILTLDQIPLAHQFLERDEAKGKLIILMENHLSHLTPQ